MDSVPPKVSKALPAVRVCGLCVAHAPIVNRFKLAEISNEYHGHVAKGELVRIQSRLAEVGSLRLLQPEMHPSEQSAPYEGDLVDNEENDISPYVF